MPPITAPEYLLRINNAGGPPGARTPVHTHPGSEAFYVLAGQLGQKTPHGVSHIDIGQSMPGHGPDTHEPAMKTTKTLGLDVPSQLQRRADEVIE